MKVQKKYLVIIIVFVLGIVGLITFSLKSKNNSSNQSNKTVEIKNDFIKKIVVGEIHLFENENGINVIFNEKLLNEKYSKLELNYKLKINDIEYKTKDRKLGTIKKYADTKYTDNFSLYQPFEEQINFKNIKSIKINPYLTSSSAVIENDDNWYEIYNTSNTFYFGVKFEKVYKRYLSEYAPFSKTEEQLKYDLEVDKKEYEQLISKNQNDIDYVNRMKKNIDNINYILNV